MSRTIVALALLIGGVLPAAADPVSIGAGIAAIAGFLSAPIIGTITVGGILASVAISVGISLVASLLMPKPSGQGALGNSFGDGGINAPEVRYTERQSIPNKRVILGEAFVGGALFFEQVKAPYLYLGLLLNHGEIDSVQKIFIGANQLSFSAISEGAALTPLGVADQPSYSTRLQVSLGYGGAAQTIDPILAADFSSLASTFRQRGIARAVFRYHYGADQTEFIELWGQVSRPNAYLLVRGVVVYDPRDPTQDLDDESTWAWSNNASLVQAYYLTRDWGGRIATDKIDWDKVAEAADYDDELVGCADGTFIKRFTIDGVATLNQKPFDVMTALLTANRGQVLSSRGMTWVSSSKPRTPVAAIYDSILAGGIEYRAAKPKRDLVNKLQVRFVASEQDYQTVDGPILDRTDLQADDGEVLTATLDLPFTLDHRRAQRLQKAFLDTSRLGRTITCKVDIAWLAVCAEDPIGNAVTFASDLFSQANGTYLVQSLAFADNFSTIELALTEYDSSIESDWNPSTDEQAFTLADLDVS